MNYSWNFVKLRAIRNLRSNLKIILKDIFSFSKSVFLLYEIHFITVTISDIKA